MYHLTLRSEYSFRECFAFLQDLHDNYSHNNVIGIADTNTFGFFKLYEMCKKSGKKAIYGYRCNVVKDATVKVKPRGQFGVEYVIIAKNWDGIKEIFNLTKINTENFYYRGNVSSFDIDALSDNVFVISTDPMTNRLDFIGVNFKTRPKVMGYDYPNVYVDDNNYATTDMRKIYQLTMGRHATNQTYPQHILNADATRNFPKQAFENLQVIVDSCEDIELKKADNVKYKGKETISDLCIKGAIKKNIDITREPYKSRLKKEVDLLAEKDFTDYILVVADLVVESKKFCLVGGGRGSSGGSLVCYLLDITEIDPIEHGLIFERFVDVNRFDAPDIDTDFPDNARQKVIRYLKKIYGNDNVKTISTIMKFKPKITISEFAKQMDIPPFETEAVKDAIVHRASGDARAKFCLDDTLKGTDAGREFLAKFPNMENVKYAEDHVKQKGKHAAGVIVCNDPIKHFAGIDERDETVILDKKDAEKLNLLKIDILGLRTLSVLQDFAKSIGMNYRDYYTLPFDDEGAYAVFKSKRVGGVFQFEGEAMASINDSIPMERFSDIVAAGALGRPGALSSGGTSRYIKLRTGERQPLYYCDKHKKITEETYGIVIYQEQMMHLCKEISGMSWEDVSSLRKAASKSLGEEFFDQYRVKFVEGAMRLSGYDEITANRTWLDISSMGSYAFNKSHSVCYGQISYWCAWAKAHHPLKFIAAILNNSKDDDSSLKILREFYEAESLIYKSVDTRNSNVNWEIKNGVLIGGLTNIKGVGSKKANDIISMRNGKKHLTDGIVKLLENPRTPFDILYPALFHFGDMYKNPRNYGLDKLDRIIDVQQDGEYAILGKMIHVDDVDANDVQSVAKRDGKRLDGPTLKVHIRVEDDSGVMMCIVGRFVYEQLAHEFLGEKVGKTWYCLIGKVLKGNKILFVSKVANLNKQVGLRDEEEIRDEDHRSIVTGGRYEQGN